MFVDIDECALQLCSATGTEQCRDGINDFVCVCSLGYTGTYCETGTSWVSKLNRKKNCSAKKINNLLFILQRLKQRVNN